MLIENVAFGDAIAIIWLHAFTIEVFFVSSRAFGSFT